MSSHEPGNIQPLPQPIKVDVVSLQFELDRVTEELRQCREEKSAAERERDALIEALKRARRFLHNFEVRPPDEDEDVWLMFHGNGTSGCGAVNLGRKTRVVAQVGAYLEEDRASMLADAAKLLGEG